MRKREGVERKEVLIRKVNVKNGLSDGLGKEDVVWERTVD